MINNENFILNQEKIAFDEMMVHVPLCTHREPSKVFVAGDVSENFKKEAAKHCCDIEYADLQTLSAKNDKELDVIIITDGSVDNMLLANIEKVLNDDGILVFLTTSFHRSADGLKNDLITVGKNFWIAMPYKFGHKCAILASKKYHPTADIILQRSDLLDDVNYYSTEIHHASFVFPSYIHKELTGIARR